MIDIRYASIRSMDISNGEGIGVALFVQGCHFRCKNCFNSETWDFNGGKEWTTETKDKFLKLASRPYIKRISILGGEPLAEENLDDVLDLVNRIRLSNPQKSIWVYTGYTWEDIINEDYYLEAHGILRKAIIDQCDVLIDGKYIDSQQDMTLKWRGSSNQRCIDIQKTLKQNKIVLYCS